MTCNNYILIFYDLLMQDYKENTKTMMHSTTRAHLCNKPSVINTSQDLEHEHNTRSFKQCSTEQGYAQLEA